MSPNLFLGFPVSRARFAEVAARSSGHAWPLEDYYWHTNFEDLNNYNKLTAGGGTITVTDNGIFLKALNTTGDRARLIWWNDNPILDHNSGTYTVLRTNVWLYSQTNSTMKLYVYAGAPVTWPAIGFQVIAGVFSAFTMMSSSRTEVVIEDWGSSGYAKQVNLKIILTQGVDCKFYVNGTLVATITTNLPAQADIGDNLFCLEVETPAGGVDGRILTKDADLYIKLT